MVQDVEEFRTELETLTFTNGGALQQRKIHIVILRTNQCVPSCISINTGHRISKYAWIEIEGRCADRCAGRNGTAADAVAADRVIALARYQVGSIRRIASECACHQTITGKKGRTYAEGDPGLALDDAAHLPSADQLPCHTRCLKR